MFTPFAFVKQEVAGGGPGPAPAFDPTLEGSLSVTHWWDFTDDDNITIDGSNKFTAINDKGVGGTNGPEDLSSANGWTFYNGGPTYTGTGNGADFFQNVIYKAAAFDSSLLVSNDAVWVMICTLNASAGTGGYAITGIRGGYEMLHQGFVNVGAGPARAGDWNNNNGAATSGTPLFIESYNKSGTNYGSFYAGFTPTTEFMFASTQLRSGTDHAINSSLNGLPFGGQTATKTEGGADNATLAIGGSGVEVLFSRPNSLSWYGNIKHIVVYSGTTLTNTNISDVYSSYTG